MTVEESKKLILEHYDSFLRQQDAEAIRQQLAPDFIDHEMPPGTPRGPEGDYSTSRHAAQGVSRPEDRNRRHCGGGGPRCRPRALERNSPRAASHAALPAGKSQF